MFSYIEDILVIKNENDICFFDPDNLAIFFNESHLSNREVINKYKKNKILCDDYKIHNLKEASSVNLELHVTENCNLRCKYCYLRNSYVKTNSIMSEKIIEKAFNFTKKEFPEVEIIKIFLFGGEPVLFWKKFDYLLKISKGKFKEKKVYFNFATNGTILNKNIQSFISRKNVSFCLSMDGPKDIQDYLRITSNNLGSSYDKILKNLKIFKKIDNSLAVRATITPYNMNITKLFDFFKEQGFQRIGFSLCSSKNFEINNKYFVVLEKELKKFSKIYFENLISGDKLIKVSPFFKLLQKLHFRRKQKARCKSGKTLFAISTDGNIYSCHRFVGDNRFKIGDLENGFDDNCQLRKQLLEFDVKNEQKCKNCFARNICGGGCLHEKTVLSSTTSCKYIKLLLILCIQIYSKLLKLPNSFKIFNQLFNN